MSKYLFIGFGGFSPKTYDGNTLAEPIKARVGTPLVRGTDKQLYAVFLDQLRSYFSSSRCYLSHGFWRPEIATPHADFGLDVGLYQPEGGADPVEIRSVSDFDAIIVPLIHNYYSYISFLRSQLPGITIIGMHDDSLQEIGMGHSGLQIACMNAIASVDGVICFTDQYARWVQAMKAEVLRITLPLPQGYVGENLLPVSSGGNAFCVGVCSHCCDFMNLPSAFIAAKRIVEETELETPVLYGVPPYKQNEYSEYRSMLPSLDFRPFELDHARHMKDLREFRFITYLTTRSVVGRLCVFGALAGTPVVGNMELDMQIRVWPDLAIPPYDALSCLDLCKRLVRDQIFRRDMVLKARTLLHDLEVEQNGYGSMLEDFINSVSR